MTGEELLEEVKRRYPIGCVYKSPVNETWDILKNDEKTYKLIDNYLVFAHNGGGWLVKDGVWAEVEEVGFNYEIY